MGTRDASHKDADLAHYLGSLQIRYLRILKLGWNPERQLSIYPQSFSLKVLVAIGTIKSSPNGGNIV